MGQWIIASLCILIALSYHCSNFGESAPVEISNGNNRSKDEPVEELENLKKVLQSIPKDLENAKQVSVTKSRTSVFTDVNGERKGHKINNEQVSKNGQLVAKVSQKTDTYQEKDSQPKSHSQTEVEIPSEGVHRTFEKDEEGVDAEQEEMSFLDPVLNKVNNIAGIGYSPLDMAEYVFWTGDEKGVTLSIEDFLQEGLMSREEAINFLQSIKANLDYIQAHYQGLRKMEDKITNKLQQKSPDSGSLYEEKLRNTLLEAMKTKNRQLSGGYSKTMEREALKEKQKRKQTQAADSGDYDEVLYKLKGADMQYNDYTLEEVIYELAKVMFSQSLAQGSKEARNALRRFTDYLEKEVAYGQISRDLEKKILGVLVAALSDTLGERPELLAAASEGLGNIGDSRTSSSDARNRVLDRRSQFRHAGEFKELHVSKRTKEE